MQEARREAENKPGGVQLVARSSSGVQEASEWAGMDKEGRRQPEFG